VSHDYEHPTIPQPKTELRPGPDRLWFSLCKHCSWTCGPSVKTHVQERALEHRQAHRRGRVPVGAR